MQSASFLLSVFASLLLTFSRFSLILFLTAVLATATFFLLSFRTWNNFSYWILLSQLAGKTISVRITLIYCFFVLRMFAIDLGTIVKLISRSPDSLGFIFCMLASRPSLLC